MRAIAGDGNRSLSSDQCSAMNAHTAGPLRAVAEGPGQQEGRVLACGSRRSGSGRRTGRPAPGRRRRRGRRGRRSGLLGRRGLRRPGGAAPPTWSSSAWAATTRTTAAARAGSAASASSPSAVEQRRAACCCDRLVVAERAERLEQGGAQRGGALGLARRPARGRGPAQRRRRPAPGPGPRRSARSSSATRRSSAPSTPTMRCQTDRSVSSAKARSRSRTRSAEPGARPARRPLVLDQAVALERGQLALGAGGEGLAGRRRRSAPGRSRCPRG